MQINIKVFQEEDLLEEDASYSLGWLQIVDEAKEICLFKDKLCMIFLTVSVLMDNLKKIEHKKAKQVRWVGEDHGYVFTLSSIDGELCIQDKYGKMFFEFQRFKSALLEGSDLFMNHCIEVNSHMQKESGFIDFKTALEDLKN